MDLLEKGNVKQSENVVMSNSAKETINMNREWIGLLDILSLVPVGLIKLYLLSQLQHP